MKVIRSTMYPPDINAPVTIIASQRSLRVPVEQAAAEMEQPGVFVVSDIFGMPDSADEVKVSMEGARRERAAANAERNMAISYYWNAAQLARMAEGGVLANPRPAPLSAKQIEVVLRQLAKHPSYRKQMIACVAKDLKLVRLETDGTISVLPIP